MWGWLAAGHASRQRDRHTYTAEEACKFAMQSMISAGEDDDLSALVCAEVFSKTAPFIGDVHFLFPWNNSSHNSKQEWRSAFQLEDGENVWQPVFERQLLPIPNFWLRVIFFPTCKTGLQDVLVFAMIPTFQTGK